MYLGFDAFPNLYDTANDNRYFTEVNQITRLLTDLYRSSRQNNVGSIFTVAGLTVLFYLSSKLKVDKKTKYTAIVLAMLISAFQIIGISFSGADDLSLLISSGQALIKALLKLIAYIILFYKGISIAFFFIDALPKIQETKHEGYHLTKQILFKTTAFIFLCWLPYFLVFIPGTSSADTQQQILQAFHLPAWEQSVTSVQGDNIFITNHHPLLLTWIYGGVYKLGVAIGNVNIAIGLYSICQMLLMAFIFACSYAYFAFIGSGRKQSKWLVFVYALNPVFAMWSFQMVKDTLFSLCIFVFMHFLVEIVRTKGNALSQGKFILYMIISALLTMLTKNQGVYICFIVFLVLLITFRERWKQMLLVSGISIILFQVCFLNILLPALGIAPGGLQEALSVPFQQTARYVSVHGDEVDAEEKEAINKVLPYDSLAQIYDPELSDPVKGQYNQFATREDLRKYFSVWAKQFLKHPGTYIQATLNNTYGYFYLEFNKGIVFKELITTKLVDYPYLVGKNPDILQGARDFVIFCIGALSKIPLINMLFSMPGVIWLTITLSVYYIYAKRHLLLIPSLPALLSILVCVLSPANGFVRYVMPMFYCLPILVEILFIKPGTEHLSTTKNTVAEEILQDKHNSSK